MKKAAQTILIAVAACLTFGGVAHAQTVKKYITPDGKTVYSDSPIPGAREVGEIKAPPKLDSSASPQTQGVTPKEAEQVRRSSRKQSARSRRALNRALASARAP